MISETTFAVVGLLFLFGALRSFVSTIYHSLYLGLSWPDAMVGGVAFAAFGTALLAVPFARSGPRRSVGVAAAVLGGATVLNTAVRAQWPDLVLGAVALAGGLVWLALFHASRLPDRAAALPVALPLAIAVDFALRSAFGTLAVAELPLVAALPIAVAGALVLFAGGLGSLGTERHWVAPSWRGVCGLLALPPLLLAGEVGGLNPAQLAAAGGFGLGPEGAGSTERATVGLGLALVLALWALTRDRFPRRLAASVFLAVGTVLLWAGIPVVSSVGGAVLGAGCLIALCSLAAGSCSAARTPARAALALAGGWLVFAGSAFAFYALYDFRPAMWGAAALGAAAALVVPGASARVGRMTAAAASVLVGVVPVVALLLVAPPADAPPPLTFRLMVWNVNQGFNGDEVADVDAVLQTIALENPDVVVLNEVTRGWLINERHDLLGVLAARLGMRYVFGPQIGDLYGNAILSRLPLADVERVHYPKEPGLRYQPRGAIVARIAGVTLLATHLDHNGDASRVRAAQVQSLLAALGGRAPALVAGDLNAVPESAELALLAQAGFVDLAAAAGAREPTYPAARPDRRIDYAWGNRIRASQAHVVATAASDHRPLVLNLEVAPR